MIEEKEFIKTINESFKIYLTSSANSNKKLKVLHKKIAMDFLEMLGDEYSINALGLSKEYGREVNVLGKYYNKKVDITISKGEKNIAGIGVKFIMSNYSQNSNNYFENMIGETVNLRFNQFKYYQVVIVFDKLPYFKDGGIINKIEQITKHNIDKYIKLDEDDVDKFFHIPNKMLLYLVHINPLPNEKMIGLNKVEYKKMYNNPFKIDKSQIDLNFKNNVIYNNYVRFLNECCEEIRGV